MSTAPLSKQHVAINGYRMAYHVRGEGRPILFLHGNPTSSYLWRDVIPQVEGLGRLIAPDLIGMGDSDKLPNPGPETYVFETHRDFLWAFIDEVAGQEPVILVLHDWGTGLGFDWANSHRDRVAGIAYMEGIVRPFADWSEWNENSAPLFQGFRSDAGEKLILDRNLFVERVLPGSVERGMSEAEMEHYKRPFVNREDRWPTLTWPRHIPVAGEPAHMVARVQAYADWLASTPLPKLFVNAEPGAILCGPARDFCRTWPNQSEVTVRGNHFLQEDSGPEIGQAIRQWITDRVPAA
jgi:haloalkane dehalogenase